MGGSADTATFRPLAPAQAAAPPRPAPASGGTLLRLFKLFLAVSLIPACVGAGLGANDYFLSAWSHVNLVATLPGTMLKWFAMGCVGFAAITVLIWCPVVLYVFGHEVVHAMATWICLGKVSNISASATGGQVTTSKSNTFIRLAPYCVPLYALLAAALYLCLNAWWRPLNDQIQWLACALGFLYTFHLGFTLWSLRRDQPDLRPDGWLFSLVLVYLANVAVFVLLMGFIYGGNPQSAWLALKDCGISSWRHSAQIYRNLGEMFQQMFSRL